MTFSKSVRIVAGLFVITTALAAASVARANTIYRFDGVCADCQNARAVLTLKNYVQGGPVSEANFVSFDYVSSVFPHGFTVVDAFTLAIGSTGLPTSAGYADLAILWKVSPTENDYFRTTVEGSWSLTRLPIVDPGGGDPGHGGGSGGGHSMDFGSDYKLTLQGPATNVSPVPLPATAPMFGAALLVLGMASHLLSRRKVAPLA